MNLFLQLILVIPVAMALLAVTVGFAFLKNPAVGMAHVNEWDRRAVGKKGRK